MNTINADLGGNETGSILNPLQLQVCENKKRIKSNGNLTYISLFSSAGVGCFGFLKNNFQCVATSELIERRMNVQKVNNKCKYESGYILGDLSEPTIKQKLFDEITFFKENENVSEIDVVIATPPCQGMSVANHKKTKTEIKRNSLVVEAINIIDVIKPKFFIFENVQAFIKTTCFDNGVQMKIGDAIKLHLSKNYKYIAKVINFKDYGANSSRTRTVVIGVRNDLIDIIKPEELFPSEEKEKTLIEIVGDLPELRNMGEILESDIYHSFKHYQPRMRKWIENIKQGESAFDNEDSICRPHKIINGVIVENVNKNGDKYKRQEWNKVAPCIHTRNDILSSQNTVHPIDDRVFSIRELMHLMNVPNTFKWVDTDEKDLNELHVEEKKKFLKQNEINIRQSIGEAVPTIIFSKIAHNIKCIYEMSN
jgi:DNA (cytosine-5)-methyltransferase 1